MEERIYLNVASGYNVLKGFVNLDNSLYLKISKIYPLAKPFLSKGKREIVEKFIIGRKNGNLIRKNCKKRYKYENNSVDHILCSHFLEHLYHDEAFFVMKEFYRILKPKGTLHIILPDLELQVKNYIKNHDDFSADELLGEMLQYGKSGLSFTHRILDVIGAFGLMHLWMYDEKSIRRKLKDIGFEIFENIDTPSSSYRHGDDSIHIYGIKQL